MAFHEMRRPHRPGVSVAALAVEFQLLEELLIARIGAKLVIHRIDAQVEYVIVRFVDGFLEPLEGGIAIASRSVIARNEGWRNVTQFRTA